ncbi:MAG: type I-U CRISPR-associated protein Csb2, partial [Gemmatimonadota bacterium]|nr:type I-U CRISPR-associated protein Csb2 [Gemmatimonadota bacterium]
AKALALVEKLKKSLAEKIRKGISPYPDDKKPPEELVDRAASLFPERRMRQPRTFPSVRPAADRVFFIWPDASSEDHLLALGSLLGRVVRLGHSSSMVRVGLTMKPPEPNWRPHPSGLHRLRVVRQGQLAALDQAFALHQETNPRVLPFAVENYATGRAPVQQQVHRSHFSSEWVVLRRASGPLVPSTATASVAKTVRKALMSFAEQPASEIITGHAPGGAPATRPHLAIIPLPFVGHSQADGGLLGIALVLPADVSTEERRSVFRALAGWEAKGIQEEGSVPIIPLHLGAAGTLQLERLEEPATQATLRSRTWCGPARRWASATPVALDRNPGELKDRNPARAAAAAEEAEAAVIAALNRIGLPTPLRVTICPHAPLAGSRKAKWFPPYPESAEKTRRVLTHVEIEFETEVEGPLLLGSGRYHGLGLFKPVVDRG